MWEEHQLHTRLLLECYVFFLTSSVIYHRKDASKWDLVTVIAVLSCHAMSFMRCLSRITLSFVSLMFSPRYKVLL